MASEPLLDRSSDPDPEVVTRSRNVDLYLSMLREAAKETGWTSDALAEHYGVNRSHIDRLLSGEKPWRIEYLVSLPADLDRRFERKRAEHLGLICVEPVSGLDAVRDLVSGLVGVLTPRLPAKADAMVKATVDARPAKVASR